MELLRWYVLQSKPHQEDTLLQHVSAAGVQVYYPRLPVRTVNPRARKTRPYFPSYMFVHTAPGDTGLFKWMPFAIGLVCFGDEPATLADQLVAGVQTAIAQVYESGAWFDELAHGDRVRIRSGPFEGYQAIFDVRLSGVDRARVLLELLGGRSVALEMSAARLEKIAHR